MDIKDILEKCDHTLLRVDCTGEEIRALCDQAIRYHCASVCIPPCHVAGAKRYVGDRLTLCTVIGFPNGYMTMVKDGCWADVANDIRAVREATRGKILKVIIECCLLTEEEKVHLCKTVADCGADFIKTSTGFSRGGATREDVKLLREHSPASLKVKAAGGIASLQDAEDFIALGADRLGTSRVVKLAMEQEKLSGAPDEKY